MHKELLMDIIQWDTINWGKCIPLWSKEINNASALHCLEIGARNGGLSLWAALNNHNVICSDLENPQETARLLHEKYKVTRNIDYQAINILDIPYENHFDIVFIKSILPSVGRDNQKGHQAKAIDSIYKSLKPGGKLLFAENLTGTRLHFFMRKKFVRWGSSVRYIELREMFEFLKDFKSVEHRTYGFWGVFGRTETQRRLLGKVDLLLNNFVPEKWNYLITGIATK